MESGVEFPGSMVSLLSSLVAGANKTPFFKSHPHLRGIGKYSRGDGVSRREVSKNSWDF